MGFDFETVSCAGKHQGIQRNDPFRNRTSSRRDNGLKGQTYGTEEVHRYSTRAKISVVVGNNMAKIKAAIQVVWNIRRVRDTSLVRTGQGRSRLVRSLREYVSGSSPRRIFCVRGLGETTVFIGVGKALIPRTRASRVVVKGIFFFLLSFIAPFPYATREDGYYL